MKRRDFFKAITAALFTGQFVSEAFANTLKACGQSRVDRLDNAIKDYLHRMQRFDEPHDGDAYVSSAELPLLKSCVWRFKRLQRVVGHGNFHLLSFDEGLRAASNYSEIGAFPKTELHFLEMVFYESAARYGFLGEKPLKGMTDRVRRRDVVKIRETGNYVFKGIPLETYKRIKEDLGNQAVLTSGVRSVNKQFLLFLNKALKSNGNLSLASRSLAPPGYSFHGVGDFDVGQAGFGAANFTERFATTDVCKRLEDLGYINLRYQRGNRLGVRFEPWHIKVT
jgi:hypothetical protein